ncbi:MAG: TIGR03936 family radical SAM-associated protein [Bacillota bacterium]|nr:TIGR03936 family radical SAM-associated protein [Bacillota bacterium]
MFTMRFRYSKTELGIYLGHLEVMKVFERAFRRAGLPIRYTEGFNPTVRLSFAAPLSVGCSSEYEIAEIVLNEEVAPERFLSLQLPAGFRILEARSVDSKQSLMARLATATYSFRLSELIFPPSSEADMDAANRLAAFADQSDFPWEKKTKSGIRTLNMMEYIHSLTSDGETAVAVLRAGNLGALNPDVLVKAIFGADVRATIHRLVLQDEAGIGLFEGD